jgi:hypothetical protein
MDEGFRRHLIENHQFYVGEGRSRLLSQFDDISADADAFAEKWASDRSHLFNPDRDDPNDIHERAWEESITHYGMLEDLHADVRLAIIAGMYHAWDKELRDWITTQIGHWRSSTNMRAEIWKASFPKLMEFLASIGWKVATLPFHESLHRCRLVVNVYKHGEGGALDALKDQHSDLLGGGLLDVIPDRDMARWMVGYRHLTVKDEHLDEFSNAIVRFWTELPAQVIEEDIRSFPKWLDRAAKRDKGEE